MWADVEGHPTMSAENRRIGPMVTSKRLAKGLTRAASAFATRAGGQTSRTKLNGGKLNKTGATRILSGSTKTRKNSEDARARCM